MLPGEQSPDREGTQMTTDEIAALAATDPELAEVARTIASAQPWTPPMGPKFDEAS